MDVILVNSTQDDTRTHLFKLHAKKCQLEGISFKTELQASFPLVENFYYNILAIARLCEKTHLSSLTIYCKYNIMVVI